MDPSADKYFSLSPYNYVANDPIKSIDPNGKEIIIPSSLKASQRNEIIKQLSSLTNDKLSYNSKTGVVSISKTGKGNNVKGTALISGLIGSPNKLTIDYQNSLGTFPTSRNQSGPVNAANASNGTGSNAYLNFDPSMQGKALVEDPKTGKTSVEDVTTQMVFGHELIHTSHYLKGDRSTGTATNTYTDAQGQTQTQTVSAEEARTVGLAGNKTTDVTENDLRKENGQKKRVAYP